MLERAQAEGIPQMGKILVATDFSAAAARARDYALALAAPGATVTVVHAHLLPLPDWPEPAYVPEWMPAEPSVREEVLERLRAFAAPVRAAGLTVETVLAEGLPADVILKQAERRRPDLIVMGTHGRRSCERWVMGSVAERVVRLAPAPVLTVCAEDAGPAPHLREVLCPLGLEGSGETLAVASDLARRSGSLLTVLHVLEGRPGQAAPARREKRASEQLREAVEGARPGVPAEVLVKVGRPAREILRVARERAVDVIVLGVHDRSAADRGFFGSTANEVVREAPCGVITVRPEALRTPAAAEEARAAGAARG